MVLVLTTRRCRGGVPRPHLTFLLQVRVSRGKQASGSVIPRPEVLLQRRKPRPLPGADRLSVPQRCLTCFLRISSQLLGTVHVACCGDAAASGCRRQRHANGRGRAADIHSRRPSDSSALLARRAASENGSSTGGSNASAALLPSFPYSISRSANVAPGTGWRSGACRLPRLTDAVCRFRGSSCIVGTYSSQLRSDLICILGGLTLQWGSVSVPCLGWWATCSGRHLMINM